MKLMKVFNNINNIIEGYITWFTEKITGKSKQLYKDRMAICQNCEYNIHGICKLCGCVLKAKTKVDFIIDDEGKSIDGCPERKW